MWNKNFLYENTLMEELFSKYMPVMQSYDNWPSPSLYNDWCAEKPVTFIEQTYTRTDIFELQYEPRIFLRREVLTRAESWHDLFNALVWMSFPKTKLCINRLHYESQISRAGNLEFRRSKLENNLTHFDECGAIVISSNKELLNLLANHCWKKVFLNSSFYNELKVLIVGHATYERLLTPYIGLTAKSLLIYSDSNTSLENIDSIISSNLESMLKQKNCFVPLPVLGIKGAYKYSGQDYFYDNEDYFRPKSSNKDYQIFSNIF